MQKLENQIVEVDFRGDRLQAVQDERGVWVSVLKVCEALGLDRRSQQAKLKNKAWAVGVMNTLTGSDGKQYEQMMLHLDCLPMWLATIETSRVKPSIRSKLELYQRECAKVLADHFYGRKQDSGISPEMLASLLTPLADALRSNTEAIASITSRLVRLEEMKAAPATHAPQFVPAGNVIGIMEQIRRLWRTASKKQLRRCASRVQAICMQKGVQVWKPLDNGPFALAEANAHIINDVVCQIRELDEAPLFSRFSSQQSAMLN